MLKDAYRRNTKPTGPLPARVALLPWPDFERARALVHIGAAHDHAARLPIGRFLPPGRTLVADEYNPSSPDVVSGATGLAEVAAFPRVYLAPKRTARSLRHSQLNARTSWIPIM